MRYSAGVTYQYSSKLALRAGAAFDEAPVSSAIDASARIPDADRIWLAAGLTYTPAPNWQFDAGYVHLFVDDASLQNTEVNTGHTLIGEVEADVNLLSAQVIYHF